jgi:hypothetical protein
VETGEIILCWACDLSGECKRHICNHGGEISWEEATCKIEELKSNIKMDLREVSCLMCEGHEFGFSGIGCWGSGI